MKKTICALLFLLTAVSAQESSFDETDKELQQIEKESLKRLEYQKLEEENRKLKESLILMENEKLKQENAYLKSKTGVAGEESWYFHFGIGSAKIDYPQTTQNSIEALKASGYTDTKVGIDLGFYWPLKNTDKTLLGFNIGGHSDAFTNETTKAEYTIGTYNYALSALYYTQKKEDGLFYRADLGLSTMVIQRSDALDAQSDFGTGVAAGIGYAFDFGGTSLQLTYLITSYRVDGERVNSQQFMIAGLF